MDRITDIRDIIDLLTEDAIAVSIETNVFPSIYLGVAIYEYEKYGDYFLLKYKNPYNTFLTENMYFNYMDAMRKFSAVNGIYSKVLLSVKNILKKIYKNDDNIDNVLTIIDSYDLKHLDIYLIQNMVHFKRPIIDMKDEDKKQKMEIYKVCSFGTSSTLIRTINLEEAKYVCNNNPGSMVVDSKGNKIYGFKDVERRLNRNVIDINYIKGLDVGSIINVRKANLYETPKSDVPLRSISGSYKISSVKINNRYKISNIQDMNLVYGYINVKEIEKINR